MGRPNHMVSQILKKDAPLKNYDRTKRTGKVRHQVVDGIMRKFWWILIGGLITAFVIAIWARASGRFLSLADSFQSVSAVLGVSAALAGAIVAIRIAQAAQMTAAQAARREDIQFSNEVVIGAYSSLSNIAYALTNLFEKHTTLFSVRDEIGNSFALISMNHDLIPEGQVLNGELGEPRDIDFNNVQTKDAELTAGQEDDAGASVIPTHRRFMELRDVYVAHFNSVAVSLEALRSDPVAKEVWTSCSINGQEFLNIKEIFDIGNGPSVFASMFRTAADVWANMDEGSAQFHLALANFAGARATKFLGASFGLVASLEYIITVGKGEKYGELPLGFSYALFTSLPSSSAQFLDPVNGFYEGLIEDTSGMAYAMTRGLERGAYTLWYGEVIADFVKRYRENETIPMLHRLIHEEAS